MAGEEEEREKREKEKALLLVERREIEKFFSPSSSYKSGRRGKSANLRNIMQDANRNKKKVG